MWILLAVIIHAGVSPTAHYIESYATLKDCEDARIFITEQMQPISEPETVLGCMNIRKVAQ